MRGRLEAAERRSVELDGRNDAAQALRDEMQRDAAERLRLVQADLDRCREAVLERDDKVKIISI